MANSYIGTKEPKGNVGVRQVVDAGELSAYSAGALSGFAGNSVSSWTIDIGGVSGVQDVAVAKNPGGESTLLVGTAGQKISFIIGGAPGTPGQSRTDALVLYKDPFATSAVNDGIDTVDYQVVAGTAATTGSQVPPNDATIRAAIPSGSLKFVAVVGYVTIAQGQGSVVLGNLRQNKSLLSGQSVADATERGLIVASESMEIYQRDIDAKLVYNGTRWKWADSPHRLGANEGATTSSGGLTTSYVTRATVSSVVTQGGEVEIDVQGWVSNATSGADRGVSIKVQCDGVDVGTPLAGFVLAPLASNLPIPFKQRFAHTPTAGSHTYTLQVLASANASVTLTRPTIIVNEL